MVALVRPGTRALGGKGACFCSGGKVGAPLVRGAGRPAADRGVRRGVEPRRSSAGSPERCVPWGERPSSRSKFAHVPPLRDRSLSGRWPLMRAEHGCEVRFPRVEAL